MRKPDITPLPTLLEVTLSNRQAKAHIRELTVAGGVLTAPVNSVNTLRWVRESLRKCGLSQTYLAAAMGISKPLVSAQLSDHEPDKHLSMRRLGHVDDVNFWREFALLILEDLGFSVVVMDEDQRAAWHQLQVAQANYQREMAK